MFVVIFNFIFGFFKFIINALNYKGNIQPIGNVPKTIFVDPIPTVVNEMPILATSNQLDNFILSIINLPPNQQREDLIFQEIMGGNTPAFMEELVEVTVEDSLNTLKYNVSPEVLCIGTNNNYLRVPLNPLTAQKIANLNNCMLPTKKMADQIWKTADLKLNPQPMGPPYNEDMQTTKRFLTHNIIIETQRSNRNFKLITGHKKDVVISKHLIIDPTKVAIYGWFYNNGQAIQPLNALSHDKNYKDYSHGIRFILRDAILNGQHIDLFEVIKDPKLSYLISDEGSYDASLIYRS